MNKLVKFSFKVIDLIVIFVMTFGSPMAALAQVVVPELTTGKPDYAPGETAQISGSNFEPAIYTLLANGPDGPQNWGTVTADGGGFVAESPTLTTAGTYEVQVVAVGSDTASATVSFTVTEPPASATPEPTVEPTVAPTDTPVVPTDTATDEPTVEPTETSTPAPDPTIQSDKADYTPGELVTLTGANWQGDAQVRIVVNDDIGQTWRRDMTVNVASDGTIFDSFNLPTFFVATYSVAATGLETGRVANTSFTDAPLPNSVSLVTWRTTPGGAWINGTLQANNSDYSEGETVPFRLELGTLNTSGNPYTANICRDYQLGNGVFGFTTLQPYDTSRAAAPGGTVTSTSGPFSGVNITITSVNETGASSSGAVNCGATQRLTIVTFNVSASGPQFLLWGGRLASPADPGVAETKSASFWSGGSLQMRLASPDKTSGIQPGAVVRLAKITVQKIVDAGSATPDQWCFNISPNPNNETLPKCPAPGTDTVTFFGLSTGNYQITETSVSGYVFASGSGTSCTFNGSTATASVASSQNPNSVINATCIFHNTFSPASIVIIKDSVPNDAQDFSFTATGSGLSNFSLDDDGDGTLSNTRTFTNLTPGNYTVIEGAVSGWSLTGLSCTDASGGTTTDTGTRTASIALAAGETVTCTFTNTKQFGSITVVKDTVPNGAQDFGFTGTGPGGYNFGGGFNLDDDADNTLPNSQTFSSLNPGTYSVAETAVSGYDTTSSCVSSIGDTETASSIELDPNESVTCTFTNTQRGTIIVEKQTSPDGVPGSFTFTGDAAGTIADDGQIVVSDLVPGVYTATENDPSPAFQLTDISCNDGTSATPSTGDTNTRTATFNLDAGETVKCTFTNTQQAAQLTLLKTVVTNDGGTATAADFQAYIDGSPVPWSTAQPLDPGSYTVSESTLAGYTATAWGGDCNADGTINLSAGQIATCTITNDDQPGTLIVKKVVINDNGGTLEEEDFTFQVNGGTATAFEADGQNDLTVNAGVYTVTEPAVSGYVTTYDNCTDVVIPNGGSATCTITNDDASAHLTLVKELVTDNGGTAAVTDWTLSADGPTPLSGAGGADGDVDAGTYSLSETGPSGYTAGAWSCVGGTQNGNDITLANGESATCTITNDDQTAHLKLVKVVVNDNGGAAEETDFTLSASGPTPISGQGGAEADVNAGTYTLSETGPSGYIASAWSCVGGTQNGSDITLANGQSATCTITNNDDAPSLTLVKVVVNDNGGTAQETDFTLSADGPTPISGAGGATSDADFDAGTYNLSETTMPGYTAGDWSCVGGTQDDEDTVTVGLGEDVTCTITNNDDAPSLTLVKQVVNDNGGTAAATDFTLSADGPTPISGAGGATSDASFEAGTYDLSETGVPGYTAGAWSCAGGTQNGAQITLELGESATCTIINNDNAPSLTLIKEVINDNGGTATEAQWTLTATGPTGFSGAGPNVSSDADFDAGTYALSESGPTGYTAGDWDCVGGTQSGSDITLELGESATCTITNNDDAPSLTLVKVVVNDNGGAASITDFVLSADGPTPISGAGGVSSDATFDAGTYDLSESGPLGYSASDWDCSGGTQDDADTITLGLGESATCTITNDDQAPSLTLVKNLINNDGGDAVESDWTLTAAGPTGISGAGPSVSSGTSFSAGTYDLSESGPAGYTASDWVCVGGTQDDEDTITLDLGESATCTITNDDVAPSLKLVKVVSNNNGGNASPDDWVLYAVADAPDNNRNFSTAGGSGVFETVYANVAYDLSESVVAGYTAGSWSCDGGSLVGSTITLTEGEANVTCTITNDDSAPTLTLIKTVINDDGGDAVIADFPLFIDGNPTTSGQSNILSANVLYTASETSQPGYTASGWVGDCNADGTITLSEGQNATCTITNDDVAPTLKLVKVVDNGNGGNATADDWTLSADATAPFDGRNFSNLGGSGDFETVFANQGYDLSESMVTGYTAGNWSCDGGSLVGSTVTLTEGENVTCTITNDDVAPQLRLIKIVVNDDGGDAVVSDFPLFIDGNPVTSGVFVEVTANTVHTATETTQPGYTASVWGGDCAPDGTITLNEGDVKTCTITNDDVAPTLRLVKVVDNGDGGNAVADDWTLSAAAAAPDDGRNFSNAGGAGAFESVFANTGYDLSETTVPGYTAGPWSCDGGTLVGSTVTLEEGETGVTCTVTNDDSAPTLTLVKVVVNDDGGNAQPNDFNLTIGGNAALSGVAYPLSANTPYTIDETQLSGYTFVDITGDAECPAVLGGTVTLDEGENVTCTITNDDVAPTLTLIKNVINDDGGNAVVADFPLFINGDPAISGQSYTLSANTLYTASETTQPGYTASVWGGDCASDGTITLEEGENATCTITNDDDAPTLKLVKVVDNDNGGNAVADDWTLSASAADPFDGRNFSNAGGSGVFETVFANQGYDLSETTLSGYTAGSWSCDGGTLLGSNVTLGEGDNVTCTITNNDVAPTLTLVKNVINDHGGDAQPDDFNLTIAGNAALSGVAYVLNANTPYAIDETLVTGYSFVGITGDPECPAVLGGTVTLDEGENVTCTITNNDQAATLIVIKHVINDNGGTADAEDFTLDSGGTDDSPDNFAGEEAPGTTVTLDAGSYNVTETGPSGYNPSFSDDCSGSIANGETKTCTVTNDDIQPQLIVIKHVINDNGGTADADDFTMNVTGNNVNPASFPGSETGTNVALDAGAYSVGETGPAGYAASYSADCNSSISVGETKTCTVTNDDISPTLTVIKDLQPNDDDGLFNLQIDAVTQAADVGDNGTTGAVNVDAGAHTVGETAGTGTNLSDYVTSIGGDCAANGTVSLALAENKTCTITNVRRGTIVIVKNTLGGDGEFSFTSSTLGNFSLTTVDGTDSTSFSGLDPADTYDVAETVPAGWELNSATCDSGETIDSIDLDPGETVTCTFENEKAGSIVIVKNTVGGNGTFNFTSTTLGNFALETTSNTASTTFSNLDVDLTYDAAETVPSGWDLTSATCGSGETIGSIDLEPGETVTCTFVNTKRGHIIVDKVTVPSGSTQSFSFDASGGTDPAYVDFNLTDAAAPNDQTLKPGSYSVVEGLLAGWDLTGLTCDDANGSVSPGTRTANITLDPGETVRCTFTNTQRGTIKIVKNALPDDAQDFAFTRSFGANFTLDDDTNATLQNNVVFTNLVPGSYSVSEGAVAGWDLTGLTCSDTNSTGSTTTRTANISLDPGEYVTCTFTNTKRGTIIVEKQTLPNGAPGSFTFTGTAAGSIPDNGTITVSNLVPGTYTSTEADPSGMLFALTSIVCNDGSSANPSTGNLTTRTATFRLDPGETVRCVFTNTKDFHPGTIGFWKNWRNHYTTSQVQQLVNYLKENNNKVYDKNNSWPGTPTPSNCDRLTSCDDLTIAKLDAIFNVGTSTPRDQMILAQLTALKLNLAITQLDGTGGLVQKNDDICLGGTVNVAGITGASAFFGTSTPTVGQIVNKVELAWTGNLTTSRNNWSFSFTNNAQRDMIINVLTGINEGTLVMSSGCP